MKIFFLLIPILLISSCTNSGNNETTTKIQSLETKIITLETENKNLKVENANLKEENNLLKAGGLPPDGNQPTALPPGVSSMTDGSMLPDGTTFEETNTTECLQKIHETYLAEGIKKCKELGYKDAEIQANKCQLDTSFINELNKKRKDAEAQCGPM
ncbi:hypothetical protein HOO68_02860 [Candidatus Gracilibacteria bacterium]|nr:hypothetical protein [Candidatus Gracilibacteria bacterium]